MNMVRNYESKATSIPVRAHLKLSEFKEEDENIDTNVYPYSSAEYRSNLVWLIELWVELDTSSEKQ